MALCWRCSRTSYSLTNHELINLFNIIVVEVEWALNRDRWRAGLSRHVLLFCISITCVHRPWCENNLNQTCKCISLTLILAFCNLAGNNTFIHYNIMSYRAGIIAAIQSLADRTGSSSIAIKKHMEANLPKDKKWQNATFLSSLKTGVEKGEFLKNKNSYKLSADLKKKLKGSSAAPKPATKSKAATKKKTVKKAAPSKKKTAKKAVKKTAAKKTVKKKPAATKSKKKTTKKAKK